MNSDNQRVIHCDVCDNLCIDRYYKSHLKSQTHINSIRKREQVNKSSCYQKIFSYTI